MATRQPPPRLHADDHDPLGADPLRWLQSYITEIAPPYTPPTDQEILDASSSPSASASAVASFAKRTTTPAGATLLDLSTATTPAIVTAGVYAVTCWFEGQATVVETNEAIACTLTLNFAGGTSKVILGENFTSGVSAGEILSVTLGATWWLDAGMTLQASLVNGTARSQTVDYALYVQRIS